ncbi:MAG: efflux RND transporter periplasmic adaptor subunit [Hydrogenophaga sp.]|uniref:efflux RND transporter periplasmic adaptor subunit n=1 Tax=Hydrogenophaga sp. TaxID=1904254 RepID=UPI0026275A3E|nr:efflux RND transporter periplasmic adaptor subunit [Hydrogenophaga sp.]MDM7941436.1 efflux RND transporter periplasmic adaptor subunit [Hydrogenophaga sp.]
MLKRLPAASLALLLLAAFGSTHAQSPAARGAASSPPVIVAASTQERDDIELTLPGNGSARQSVVLFPAGAGEVAEVTFRSGQAVRAAQVLLRLDDRTERLAADLAAARVEAARALADRYEGTRGTGAVPESVLDEARAALRATQIELAQAREAVADRVVRAPFAGVVGLATVERGDRVTPETALTTLDDRRVLFIDFNIPEAYLARVRPGQVIKAMNPAYPGRVFDGAVAQIDSRIDPVSRNVRVRAAMPNPDDLLRSGMSFQVQLGLAGPPRVSVPELALQWDRDGSFVWVVREGRSVRLAARPVRRGDGRVLLDGDLEPGETVVVEGVQRLRPGIAVRVIGNGGATRTSP